jgi:hypothetical protein
VTGIAGALLILAGLGLSVWLERLRSLRWFDRPDAARHRGFDGAVSLLRWLLILLGLAALGRVSRPAAYGALAILSVLWGYRRFIRSVGFQRWLLLRDYRALRRERPGAPEQAVLLELVRRRDPRWGDELIEQMVSDYPDAGALARIVVRMERGFRGFRP